uniref:peptidylprolyl isomerase n=1 Tax=candidate division WOR-3 bacterium TaxID=2052148 RepID=A0A7V3ZU17_UNCW3
MIWFLWFTFIFAFPYDYIIAYVDDDIILYSEFQKNYLLIKNLSPPGSDTLMLKDSLLLNLINMEIITKEATKETISLKEKELEEILKERLAKLKENPSFNKQIFEEFKEFFKNNLRQELLMQKLLTKKKLLNITITPWELKNFYETTKDSLAKMPAVCEIAHIFFPILPKKEKEEQAQRKITEIYEILLRGGDFEEICKSFSEDKKTKELGGYLGEFFVDSLPEEFRKAIEKLKVNEYSLPFRSQYGYHIVKKLGEDKKRVKIAHILIKVSLSKEDTLETKKLLLKIREKALKGEDFTRLAKEYSYDLETKEKGGYLGEFVVELLSSPFKEVCEKLDSGDISEPVLSKEGFHLIKILKKKKERLLSFSEIQEDLRNLLYQKKLREIIDDYLKKVKEDYFIKINI